MNPLTLVKRIQQINSKEAALGISESASWHAKYKESAYVFVGGIPFDLTEGDLLAVFAQYGEIVDVNLVRDKGTGKSKGFAFIAYEDQRSTNLAVDNLNGAQILGRIIRVDHVTKYKKKEEEDEEEEQRKREERGVCRAFQRGECNRGAACKFSHDEQRAANTGWGPEDYKKSRLEHERFDGPPKSMRKSGIGEEKGTESNWKHKISRAGYQESREHQKRSEWKDKETSRRDGGSRAETGRSPVRHDLEPSSRDNNYNKERKSRRHESEYYKGDEQGKRGDRRSNNDRDYSSHHRSDRHEYHRHGSDR